ncbi:MAG TPA: class I SAM-dependent methyltransferase [Gaiellaceae bacterium]|nr:class I SAM-dependent methyltransferase [Gaiellaceae bacterium]
MAASMFDAVAYKETTRRQWQDAADAWHRWDPVFDAWLGAATELLLDLTGVAAGTRVLDVAAGSGGQSIVAARRGAAVLATDLSANILAEARAAAQAAGVELATQVADGEELDVEPSSFDAVISRLGLMYLPHKRRALERAAAALRPGGRYGALVFAEPEANGFFSVPISIIRRRAGLPAPAPGLPGPFSAANLEEQLVEAGYADVEVHRVEAPLLLADAAECTRLERESFGALHQMLAGLDAAGREDAWREVEEALRAFDGPSGFAGPCVLLVGAGTKA